MKRSLFLVPLLLAGVAHAQIVDSRSLATGGTQLGRPTVDFRRGNPAALAAPSFEPVGERSIPLPIGVLNTDFPTLEPTDDDFDLVALADFLWNIPWNLQVGRADPPSSDFTVRIA